MANEIIGNAGIITMDCTLNIGEQPAEATVTIKGASFSGVAAGGGISAISITGGSVTVATDGFINNVEIVDPDGTIRVPEIGPVIPIPGGTIPEVVPFDIGEPIEKVTISDAVFLGRTAGKGGAIYNNGGTLAVVDTLFSGNTAADGGGAIYSQNGALKIAGGTFRHASDTVRCIGESGLLTLGGTICTAAQIYAENAIDFEPDTQIDIALGGGTTTTIIIGPRVAFLGNYDTAFANDANFSLTVTLSAAQAAGKYLLADSAANFNKMVVLCIDGADIGTATLNNVLTVDDRDYFLSKDNDDNVSLSVGGGIVENAGIVTEDGEINTVVIGDVIYTGDAYLPGEISQALFDNDVVAAQNATLERFTIAGGKTFVGDVILIDGGWGDFGGAVRNKGTFEAEHSTFQGNGVSQDGGAVQNEGSFTAKDCTFYQNYSNNTWGGAVCNETDCTFTAIGCNFTENRVKYYGGAVYNNSGIFTADNCEFNSNTSGSTGGAVNNSDYSTFMTTNCTFSGNSAEGSGGAVDVSGTCAATSCTFNQNQTEKTGGAVYVYDTFTADNCTFNGNTAKEGGGAIFQASPSSASEKSFLTIRDSSFLTASDTIYIEVANSTKGSTTFGGKISLAGNLHSGIAITVEEDTEITFDLRSYSSDNTVEIITGLDRILTPDCGAAYSVRLNEEQAYGKYLLATGASDRTISIVCNDEKLLDSLGCGKMGIIYQQDDYKAVQLSLEDHSLFFTVSNADSYISLLSLKELIASTMAGVTAVLSWDFSYKERDADFHGITIDGVKKIYGDGHSIDAKSQKCLFSITKGGYLTLESVTLANAICPTNGAAVYNIGIFSADNCTFSGNTAGYGGAVYSRDGAVAISDSVFATETDTIYIEGGELTLSGSIWTAAAIYSRDAISIGTGTELMLDLSSYSGTELNDGLMLNYDTAFAPQQDNLTISVNIGTEQEVGSYVLATGVGDAGFKESISVHATGSDESLFRVALGGTTRYNGRNYSLASSGSDIVFSFSVVIDTLYVNSEWTGLADGTEVEIPDGTTATIGADAVADLTAAKQSAPEKIKFAGGSYSDVIFGGSENGSPLAVEANTNLTFMGGTFSKSVFAGNKIQTTDNFQTVTTESSLEIQAGSYSAYVMGGDFLSTTQPNAAFIYSEGSRTINISGGTFSGLVAGGSFIKGGTTTLVSQFEGDIDVTISGGTFENRIYGGDITDKQANSTTDIIDGNIHFTIDASENSVDINECIVCGSYGYGTVKGDVVFTVKGSGSNLCFSEDSVVNGGSGSGYLKAANGKTVKEYDNFVNGTSTAVFDGFSGDFSARLTLFDAISFSDGADVSLTNMKDNLAELSAWQFANGSSVTFRDAQKNDFKGDALDIDLTGWDGTDDWTLATGGSDAFSGFKDFKKVKFDGVDAHWDNGRWLSQSGDFALLLSDSDGRKSMVLAKVC